jgi:hypothetical protein
MTPLPDSNLEEILKIPSAYINKELLRAGGFHLAIFSIAIGAEFEAIGGLYKHVREFHQHRIVIKILKNG